MESKLNLLKNINFVDAPESMYENIMEKISARKQVNLPFKRVSGIAASLVLILCIEAFFIIEKTKVKYNNTLETLLPTQNYELYE